MTKQEIPCCENCPYEHTCPLIHKGDCSEHCNCEWGEITKIIGCLSHPHAHAYLMVDAIKELEGRKANCDDVKSGLNIGSDSYAQLNIASKAFEQSISLIRDGVNK